MGRGEGEQEGGGGGGGWRHWATACKAAACLPVVVVCCGGGYIYIYMHLERDAFWLAGSASFSSLHSCPHRVVCSVHLRWRESAVKTILRVYTVNYRHLVVLRPPHLACVLLQFAQVSALPICEQAAAAVLLARNHVCGMRMHVNSCAAAAGGRTEQQNGLGFEGYCSSPTGSMQALSMQSDGGGGGSGSSSRLSPSECDAVAAAVIAKCVHQPRHQDTCPALETVPILTLIAAAGTTHCRATASPRRGNGPSLQVPSPPPPLLPYVPTAAMWHHATPPLPRPCGSPIASQASLLFEAPPTRPSFTS